MNLEELTLEEKIGQKIILGFRGLSLAEADYLQNCLESGIIGGVLLFDKDLETGEKRNISDPFQIIKLITDLKSNSKYPLFVALDQEGGKVARLNSSNGFEEIPSAMEIAFQDNFEYAQMYFKKIAETLKYVGINVNFAPVVDLGINSNNTVVVGNGRCFGSDPEKVANYAKIFINAHLELGIIPVAKHFPGHGSSFGDSHLGWVDISNTWTTKELQPYELLNDAARLPAVMVGHLYNRHIDPNFPASISHIWIEEILRKQIGFEGLVFSDDLQMKAICDYFTLEEVVELAFKSGIDILVFANQLNYQIDIPKNIIEITKNLLFNGKLTDVELEKSVQRILKIKNEFMLN
ncbi:MAG: glycoside hydrolase family 3 N-terminal domain-containing protein [Candidatus Kapaibacteriota bacterium]